LEYPDEATSTIVEGALHQRIPDADPLWDYVAAAANNGVNFAVSFREMGYETKGTNPISFDGEYRAVVSGMEMSGTWFSGKRPIGSFILRRT
jgi:hypothetical protein